MSRQSHTSMYGNSLDSRPPSLTYYQLLDLSSSASPEEIRQAYRRKSKQFHPDTTTLPPEVAKVRFHALNEAYATLSNAESRQRYDRQLGLGIPPGAKPARSRYRPSVTRSSAAYLDARDRPLSPGELFALLILGMTFVGCLVLAIVVGFMRGEMLMQAAPLFSKSPTSVQVAAPSTEGPEASAEQPHLQPSCQPPHFEPCLTTHPSSSQTDDQYFIPARA